ncbi:hypothetical protein [Paenibacillus woosongensis]|uniref:Uncharacterized protein n=1 Tax=Paenibacillus woosongensis TaxID=307580 RepID=A0ABQ4MQC3_9BACL|nr:hypothetical protein [Paenibacillus woosongensis]GIP58133.1 hypothetical protein J15TS10_19470 [Paenibacillus woosongensis]
MSESNSLNSLTTIYSRLTTLGESEQVLNSIGISMKDMNGNVKNGSEVLDEVAGKWSNLSKEQQYNTALQLAGQSQLSRFIALMENYDTSTRASEAALNSQGSAMRENADYMNSLEARIQTMKTAWDTLALSMGNAVINDSIIGVTSVLTGLMKVLTFSIDKIGLLPTLLGIVGTSAFGLSAKFRTATIAVLTLGRGMTFLGIEARAASMALKTLVASTGFGLALVALSFVIEKVINLFGNAKESQEEYFENLKQNIADTEQEINSLEKLSNQLKDNTKAQDELNRLYEQTTGISSELIDHYTAEGDIVYKTKEQIDDLIKAKKEELLLNRQIALHEAKNIANESVKTINDNNKKKDKTQTKRNNLAAESEIIDFFNNFVNENELIGADISAESIAKLDKLRTDISNMISDSGIKLSDTVYLRNLWHNLDIMAISGTFTDYKGIITSDLKDLDNEIRISTNLINNSKRELAQNLTEIGSLYMETNGIDEAQSNIYIFNQNLASSFIATNDTVNKSGDQLKSEFEAINEEITAFLTKNQISLTEMIDSGNFDLLMKEIPDSEKLFEHLASQFSQSVQKKLPVYDALGKKIGEISGIADEAAGNFYNLNAKFDDNGAVIGFTGTLRNLSGLLEYLSEHVSNAQNGIKLLEEAEDELNQTNHLSVGTLQKIVEKYGDRIDISNLTKDGIKDLIKAIKEEEATQITSEINKTQTTIDQTKKRIAAMKTAMTAFKILEKITGPTPLSTGFNAAIEEEEKKLEGLLLELEISKKSLKDIYSYTSRSSGSKSNSKSNSTSSNKQHLDETQAIINGINKEIVAREKLNEAISKRAKELEEEERYADAIEKTNILLASQNKEIEELNTANSKLKAERNKLQGNSKHDMSSWLDDSGQQSHAYIKLFNSSSESEQKVLQDRFDKWKLFSDAISANDEKMASLNDAIKTTSKSLDVLKLSETKSYLDQQKNVLADLNYEMDISEKTQAMFSEETKEYNEQTKIQNGLLQEKIKFLQEEVDWATRKLAKDELTNEQIEELNEYLKQNKLALLDAQKAASNLAETYTDQIISNFKKMIETQRDLELDTLEKRTKAENKRHETFMQNIDDEDKRFEEYINKQIKLLDRQNTADDYETELEKKLKERQKIQKSLNKWSLDQSMEGKAKRKELQDQLDAADEEIERFKLERERTLTKEGLQDQLDDRKKYTEKVKKDQDDLHKETLEKIDSEKEKLQQKYKDLLENEKYFYEMKKNLLSQDAQVVEATLNELKGKYNIFFSILKDHAFETSQAFENLNYAMQLDFDKLLNFPIGSNSSSNNGNNSNTASPSSPASPAFTAKELEIIEIMKGNSKAWAAATNQNRKNEIAAENLRLGAQIGATRDDKTGIWYKNGVKLYHDGGEVGVAGTTTQTWWEKIKSTLKPNEELGILKTGEVVLDNPLQFVYNFAGEMSKKLSLLSPSSSTANAVQAVSGGGVAIDTVIIQANDRETGTSLLNKFESAMNRSIKIGTFKK